MKSYILMFFSFIVFGFMEAQEKNDVQHSTDFALGVKAGLNISDFMNNDQSKSVLGFQMGFSGEFRFNKLFSVQPELLFSTQGAKLAGGNINLQYFTIPVVGKYYVSQSIYVESGPQLSFLLSAKQSDMDIRDSFKTTDISFDFGTGYLVSNDLAIGLRYSLGLTRLRETFETGGEGSRNSVFQIILGYKFY